MKSYLFIAIVFFLGSCATVEGPVVTRANPKTGEVFVRHYRNLYFQRYECLPDSLVPGKRVSLQGFIKL